MEDFLLHFFLLMQHNVLLRMGSVCVCVCRRQFWLPLLELSGAEVVWVER